MSTLRRSGTILGLCLLSTGALAAQAGGRAVQVPAVSPAENANYQEAARLESGGSAARAADLLRPLLAQHPAEFRFLYLLDRCLLRLDQRVEMLPYISRAVQSDSTSISILGIAVRTFAVLRFADSAQHYAERWSRLVPGSPVPFRDWSEAAAEGRDRAGALVALQIGRKVLGSPTALAADMAQAYQFLGDYSAATSEWLAALSVTASFRNGAVMLLGQAPMAERPTVMKLLQGGTTDGAKQLRGLLMVRWGQAAEGATLIRNALPTDTAEALNLLRDVLDALPAELDQASQMARASVLETMAMKQSGATAVRNRLEAARAYADAGSDREARRVLATISTDPSVSANMASSAAATLLGVLISEGKAAEAETALEQIHPKLNSDDYDTQRRRVALLWARQGKSAHAEEMIRDDSTVAGIDLMGRIRLFAGDLHGAAEALRYAGPFDDSRSQAVSRITILTFLQAVNVDSSAQLGAAFLALDRGDSTEALRLFDSLATTFRPAGAAEAALMVGQLAVGLGDTARAGKAFAAADVAGFPGTAATARFERARLLVAGGKHAEARSLLESLILDFPDSAVIPDARRLREEIRSAVSGGNR